jgi:adenylate cyclase
MPQPQVYRWVFDIPVPRRQLWRYVSDTQRINRIAGLFRVDYDYRPLAGGGSEVHGRARTGGMTLRWIERPGEWIEHEFFRITRDYQAGPFKTLTSEVRLEDGEEPGTTRLTQTVNIEPNGRWGAVVSRIGSGRTRRGFAKAYALAERWAEERGVPFDPEAQPSTTRQRVQARFEELVAPVAERLEAQDVYEPLARHVTGQAPEELASLAPYVLADTWELPRGRVLQFFLHAAKAGAFDVRYSLICPSCRRSKALFSALSEVTTTGHCPTCNIDFGVDFDRAVEVRFSPAPLGLEAEPIEYCHAGPQNTPHRVASWFVEPGPEQRWTLTLEPGRHQLVSPQCKGAVFCQVVVDPAAPTEATVTLTPEGIEGLPRRLAAGQLTLRAQTRLPEASTLTLVRAVWADDAVSAAEITSMQEFRDLFGSEILAPGAEFGVQNMVFLFSDLVGSTALYERIGDAAAFALVRDHFELMKQIYVAHGGSLVKTIGDAVMAVFRQPRSALAAALEMHRRIERLHDRVQGEALMLRIGLHRGPCIAMEANGLVDYFGTTVNLAARVQGRAGAGETALSPAMVGDAEICAFLSGEGRELPRRQLLVQLKGLSGDHELMVLGGASS